MRVPLSWLAEFVDLPDDIARLAEDLTRIGLAVDGIERHDDDTVLDLDITTNRVDCMNIHGVAREVATLCRRPLKPLELEYTGQGEPAADAMSVTIEATDLCTRFAMILLDVRMGPSPAWMQRRLELVGVRAVSNVVDLTNYVMMEMGQPTHAFDHDLLPEHELVVRWAREGESLRTLDGVERTLTAQQGVVAGPTGALALAGVMGGASSEVSDSTRVVALEAAHWWPLAIRRTARALGMHSEASHRFERVADPEAPPLALARIGHLLTRLGMGTVRPGLLDRGAAPARLHVRLRPARIMTIVGCDVPKLAAERTLRGLGFEARPSGSDAWDVTVPSWRGDVTREIDLVEEVARHHGLDRVPASLPPTARAEGLRLEQRRERAIREILTGAGWAEVVNLAFGRRLELVEGLAAGLPLANPLSEEQAVLRTSLVLPGLLGNLGTNRRHGRRDAALFELGTTFAAGEAAPREELSLGLLLAGSTSEHWSGRERALDIYDLLGVIELLAARLAVELTVDQTSAGLAFLHPGQSARLHLAGAEVGWIGGLHPDVLVAEGIDGPVFVAEVGLTGLLGRAQSWVQVAPQSRFPAVTRDLSLLCRDGVTAASIGQTVRQAAGEQLVALRIKDRYAGPQVPTGHFSLTVSLLFQDATRTLASEEVQRAIEATVVRLREAGVEIRAES